MLNIVTRISAHLLNPDIQFVFLIIFAVTCNNNTTKTRLADKVYIVITYMSDKTGFFSFPKVHYRKKIPHAIVFFTNAKGHITIAYGQ